MGSTTETALREQCISIGDTIADYVQQLRAGVDNPTVDGVPLDDWPLEVIDQRGREFAVVISTGGPHIEVVADGQADARLEGAWWGDNFTTYGSTLTEFLEHFIDRDGDQ